MKIPKLCLAVPAICAASMIALLLVLTLGVAQGSGVTPTNTWMDLYSSHSTFAGVPIPAGANVAVLDPQGTQCGEFTVKYTETYGIMPCYGDDLTMPGDQGAMSGDVLHFTVNGVAATPQPVIRNSAPVPAGTPVTWSAGDRWQVDLIVPPRPPVTITLLTTQLRLDWQHVAPEIVAYEVWRSTTPYFAPGDPGTEQHTIVPSAGALNWVATGGLGDPTINYTYRIRSLNAFSLTVGMSQAVGEFEFALVR